MVERQDFTPKHRPFTPPPKGWSADEVAALVKTHVPGRAGDILALARPAIRIWPAPDSGDPAGSRIGGLPALPRGREWPMDEDEALAFVGQVNLAQVQAAVGASALPAEGLLLFFGYIGDIEGCGAGVGGRVLAADAGEALTISELPEDLDEPYPSCGMSFFAATELPDPRSDVIAGLGLDAGDKAAYEALYRELGNPYPYGSDFSKLLGWPNLIQCDLTEYGSSDVGPEDPLLIQIGDYVDGVRWQGWGPGGTIYFTVTEKDLAAGRLTTALMSVQNT